MVPHNQLFFCLHLFWRISLAGGQPWRSQYWKPVYAFLFMHLKQASVLPLLPRVLAQPNFKKIKKVYILVNTEVFLNTFNRGRVIIPLHHSKFNSKIPQCSFRHTTRTKRQARRCVAYLKHLKITPRMTPLLYLLLRHWQHRKTSSCLSVSVSSGVKTELQGGVHWEWSLL